MDCLDPSLSPDERDRCGLWYQMSSTAYCRSHPIPSCEEYVTNGPGPCSGPEPSQSWYLEVKHHGLGVYCSSEGRVMGVRVKPWLESRVSSPEGDVCEVVFEGSLAPQLRALDNLLVVYAASWFTETSWDDCTVVRKGRNLTGSIPQEWDGLKLTYVDVSGNGGLRGEVPTSWAGLEGLIVRIAGTQLRDNDQCDLDCFSLEGPARDRCALWFQMNLMSKRGEFWLPPCQTYAMAPRRNCLWELPKEWEDALIAARQATFTVGVATSGMSRFVGWEQTMKYHCNDKGRITWVEILPYAFNERGNVVFQQGGTMWDILQMYNERLLNPYMVPGVCGGKLCTFYYDTPLAPQLGALDRVEGFGGNAGMFSLGGDNLMAQYKCAETTWVGSNLTGMLPKELGRMSSLVALELFGNGHLSGAYPREWLQLERDVYKGFMASKSNLTPPTYSRAAADKFCKKSQRTNGGFIIMHGDESVSITVNIEKSLFEGDLFEIFTYSFKNSNWFYCGKEPHASLYVGLVWGLFGIAVAVAIAVRYFYMEEEEEDAISQTTRRKSRPLTTVHEGDKDSLVCPHDLL